MAAWAINAIRVFLHAIKTGHVDNLAHHALPTSTADSEDALGSLGLATVEFAACRRPLLDQKRFAAGRATK
jgi:hypothetical protein